MEKKNSILHSLEVIENQISEKLTVEHIANSVHFSKFHYQRLFREMVGGSVMEYVTRRKLTLAGKELLETSTAVVDIAIKFGYDSREGFARSFKAYMGVTPGEYRKYGLAAITQNKVKEQGKMTYSKTTNEIIRELNEFIVKARDAAGFARQEDRGIFADRTDALANRMQAVLERITAIAERPDEITNRFAIINIIIEASDEFTLLSFHMHLMFSRERDADPAQNPMCQKYFALASTARLKLNKIMDFFNELSALIWDDIKKSYTERIQQVVQTANSVIASIKGYDNIKNELESYVERLGWIPFDEMTAIRLKDCLFQLNIISFAADIDMHPNDKKMFAGLDDFKTALSEAIEFTETLPTDIAEPIENTPQENIYELAFNGNILFFYIRGEIEKINSANVPDANKKHETEALFEKMSNVIMLAHDAYHLTDISTEAKKIAQGYSAIASDMNKIANELGLYGNPIKFLSIEVKKLADLAMKLATV